MPTASVVESRPDLSDEDTRQCKPFADGSDGQHRVTCLVWCQCPGYHTTEQTWLSSSAAHHSLRKAAQELSGVCLPGWLSHELRPPPGQTPPSLLYAP